MGNFLCICAETWLGLSFKSAGRVAEIMVEEGDQVEAGEVLANYEEIKAGPSQEDITVAKKN